MGEAGRGAVGGIENSGEWGAADEVVDALFGGGGEFPGDGAAAEDAFDVVLPIADAGLGVAQQG